MSATPDSNLAERWTARRPLVFISHRHQDKPLADVIARFLRGSSGGRVDVFQSSDAESDGPRAGGNLTDQLRDALWKAGLVILLYTRQDADWAWCMFECGLALQPNTPDTRLKVFTCGNPGPPQFLGRVVVKTTERADVQRFTNDYLTEADFFPDLHEKVAPGFFPNDANVVEAAGRLFTDLQGIDLPQEEKIDEWPAFPFLQLEIAAEDAIRLAADIPRDVRLRETREVLLAAPITDSDSEGARIFGRRTLDPGTTFGSLLKGWCDTFGDPSPAWMDALVPQVSQAIQWAWPNLRWELMRSIDDRDATLYGPVVTRIRRWPSKRMQFDVSFNPFGLTDDGKHVKVGIPSGATPPGQAGAPEKRVE
jgi:hypothetical protein